MKENRCEIIYFVFSLFSLASGECELKRPLADNYFNSINKSIHYEHPIKTKSYFIKTISILKIIVQTILSNINYLISYPQNSSPAPTKKTPNRIRIIITINSITPRRKILRLYKSHPIFFL